MKARQAMARVSGRAMRAGATRRPMALCWPRAAKAMVRGTGSVSHADRHVHAWMVNVRVDAGVALPVRLSTTLVKSAQSSTTRASHHTTVRELRTMLQTSYAYATPGASRTVQRNSARIVRRSTIVSRPVVASTVGPGRITQHREGTTAATPNTAVMTVAKRLASPSNRAKPAQTPPTSSHSAYTTTRELVWSKTDSLRNVDRTVETLVQPVAQSIAHGTPTTQSVSAEIATAVTAQVRKATAAYAAPQGPALDRLADEVMRRVEKNLRIERERRGR